MENQSVDMQELTHAALVTALGREPSSDLESRSWIETRPDGSMVLMTKPAASHQEGLGRTEKDQAVSNDLKEITPSVMQAARREVYESLGKFLAYPDDRVSFLVMLNRVIIGEVPISELARNFNIKSMSDGHAYIYSKPKRKTKQSIEG